MPFVLDVMRRAYDLGLPVRLRFCSPFSLAVNVRGIENLLMDILTAPRFAHRLLTFLTDDVLIPWVQTQREAIGQPQIRANGADAAASLQEAGQLGTRGLEAMQAAHKPEGRSDPLLLIVCIERVHHDGMRA